MGNTGDITKPRYYHLKLGEVVYLDKASNAKERDRIKEKFKKRIEKLGGDPKEIEYRAGLIW